METLTPRERDVLQLVAQGWRDRQIAEKLGLHPRTVSDHVAVVLLKLGAKTRAEAVFMAIRAGILDLPPEK